MTIVVSKTRKEAGSIEAWSVSKAKAKLSEGIQRALSDGPQTITRKGRKAVVVVSAEEWERKTRRTGNLAEFFAESLLRDAKVKIERLKHGPPKIDL
ncbi:type II toxin-antitoxin system prevent-host-death family antitoxin [Verrucomicrobium sp. 3C]|uniref:type II toxin-antitoxin system prevent-host-death family antitoxin n=1 Tax=Verrucomicrobium sp. 3C TaxID=1134055 RepID=UPI00035EE8A8|nr:type II toxin-antitoxin system prevent-host-death family antitoxin [Verrucomicrobium sp. 3C]